MQVDVLTAVPFLAWLASGLAALALAPRNLGAQALAAAGVLLNAAWLVEAAATEPPESGARAEALLRVVGDGVFLLGLAAVVTALATVPDGRWSRGWHQLLAAAMAVAAVLGFALRLVGSASVTIGAEPLTAVPNPYAVDGLTVLGALGDGIVASEPLWVLLGVTILVLRWRDRRLRPALTPVLLSIVLLALLLVAVVAGEVAGSGTPVSQPLFLVALAAPPITLLLGMSWRARGLQRALLESRARLVTAEDEARRGLERDLHDGVQQHLVGILTLTGLASRHVDRDPGSAGPVLHEIRDALESTIGELRELVRGIRPPALQDAGVAAALGDRFSRLPVPVDLVLGANGRRWAPEVEATAYFFACEAVTNAVKHARGDRIQVSLTAPAGHLRVQVSDNGRGLGPDVPPGGGLDGLRDRVESLGGTFTVTSSPSGTTLVADLPEPS